MTINDTKLVHGLLVNDDWAGAAAMVIKLSGQEGVVIKNRTHALTILRSVFQFLLDNEMYLHAATLQWGKDVFQSEPESVSRSFAAVQEFSKLLVMGGSSLGKTYGIGAWMLLDYLRDPFYTSVKLAAISEKHLKENLFPHVVKLWRNLAIPVSHNIEIKESELWLGIKEAGFEFGVSGIAFKQSQETSGQFKGYKFMPVRKRPHPKFGYFSRLRVLGDETQNWPGGPFQDFNSLLASMDDSGRVKIVLAFNPESTSCHVVKMAEPPNGWTVDGMETEYDYDSATGWRVCRLDAAKCENIIQRKEVYPGMQTYKGYQDYLKAGGDSSPAFSCFARGWPPMKGSVNIVIPPTWPQEARGEATFIESPISCAAVDLAFMGKDSAQMAIGRWGLASGWHPQNSDKFVTFKDRLNIDRDQPRHVLQIDQIMPMQKHDNTVAMAEEIIGHCKTLNIQPEWLAVDKTGYGFGVHGHLTKVWGDALGIAWNEGSTERKILAEDQQGADKQADGVMSEMWWAFRRWLEPAVRAILINPIIPPHPIHTQLTSRRFEPNAGKGRGIKVEAKEKYVARNKSSPDEADALVMLLHVVRCRSEVIPGLVEQQQPSKDTKMLGGMKWIKVKDNINVDVHDSVNEDGQDDK